MQSIAYMQNVAYIWPIQTQSNTKNGNYPTKFRQINTKEVHRSK